MSLLHMQVCPNSSYPTEARNPWTNQGNPWIPGHTLKISQIPGLSRASLDGWQLWYIRATCMHASKVTILTTA